MFDIEFTGVKMKNFRCSSASVTFPHGPVHIVGDNGKGKSTIGEAIIFALYGVTVTGSTKNDALVQQEADSTSVEIGLNVVGKSHTVTRTKHKAETGSKVWVDGVKSNQAGVLRLVGLDQKEFLSMFNPSYFLAWVESDQKGAQDFFARLLPKPNPIELTAKLSEGFRDDLDEDLLSDINGNLLSLKHKKDEIEKKENFLSGQISETERQLQDTETTVDDDTPILARLAELSQARSILVVPARPIPHVPVNVSAVKTQINALTITRNTLQITTLPQEPEKTCDACGQNLAGPAMEKAVSTWQEIKKQMRDANVKIQNQRGQLAEQIKVLTEQLTQAEQQNADQAKAYPDTLAEWEQQTAKSREDLQVIDVETSGLQSKLGQITAQKEDKKRRDDAKVRLTDLQKQQAEIDAKAKTITNQVNALTQASKAAAEMLAEQIQGHLNHVSLKLFDLVKTTGEVKPAFRILYDGKPTPFLSFSERTKAGMELRQLVAALREIEAPVFVDNKESISILPDLGNTQVLMAEVITGQELQVLDEQGYGNLRAKLVEEKRLPQEAEQIETAEPQDHAEQAERVA